MLGSSHTTPHVLEQLGSHLGRHTPPPPPPPSASGDSVDAGAAEAGPVAVTASQAQRRPNGYATDTPIHDLLIANGRVIDPANGIDACLDVAVRWGTISAVGEHLDPSTAAFVYDATGLVVTPVSSWGGEGAGGGKGHACREGPVLLLLARYLTTKLLSPGTDRCARALLHRVYDPGGARRRVLPGQRMYDSRGRGQRWLGDAPRFPRLHRFAVAHAGGLVVPRRGRRPGERDLCGAARATKVQWPACLPACMHPCMKGGGGGVHLSQSHDIRTSTAGGREQAGPKLGPPLRRARQPRVPVGGRGGSAGDPPPRGLRVRCPPSCQSRGPTRAAVTRFAWWHRVVVSDIIALPATYVHAGDAVLWMVSS
jgi:hypothetical protein